MCVKSTLGRIVSIISFFFVLYFVLEDIKLHWGKSILKSNSNNLSCPKNNNSIPTESLNIQHKSFNFIQKYSIILYPKCMAYFQHWIYMKRNTLRDFLFFVERTSSCISRFFSFTYSPVCGTPCHMPYITQLVKHAIHYKMSYPQKKRRNCIDIKRNIRKSIHTTKKVSIIHPSSSFIFRFIIPQHHVSWNTKLLYNVCILHFYFMFYVWPALRPYMNWMVPIEVSRSRSRV